MDDKSYCLFFEGKELNKDSEPLNAYRIKNKDTIKLIEKEILNIRTGLLLKGIYLYIMKFKILEK